MIFSLFLDDQWADPDTTERVRMPKGYTPAASSAEAIALVQAHGLPVHMMLDFDLGPDGKGSRDTTERFLKWLDREYSDGPVPAYTVHSKNIVGTEWIRARMACWERHVASLEKP